MGHLGTHAISVSLYPNLAYKPDADFEANWCCRAPADLDRLQGGTFRLKTSRICFLREANSEKLNMAHTGVGSNSFSYALVLNATLGTKPTMVPFGSNAPAMTALLGGQVDYFMGTILDVSSHYGSGAVKSFAFGGTKRHPTLPNVQRLKRLASKPGLIPWWALFARRVLRNRSSMPSAEPWIKHWMTKYAQALARAWRRRPDKDMRGPQQLAMLVKSDIARWTPIIKAANVRAE